jgi:hypothetical protein
MQLNKINLLNVFLTSFMICRTISDFCCDASSIRESQAECCAVMYKCSRVHAVRHPGYKTFFFSNFVAFLILNKTSATQRGTSSLKIKIGYQYHITKNELGLITRADGYV